MQAGMMEIRLQREEEKRKSVLYQSKAIPQERSTSSTSRQADSGTAMNGSIADADGPYQQLSEEQLQLFEEENQGMLRQFEDQLDAVRCVHQICHTQSRHINARQSHTPIIRRNIRAPVDTGDQSSNATRAYRSAGPRLVHDDGECRQRKQGAQASDGKNEHCQASLSWDLCLLHLSGRVGPDILSMHAASLPITV